jgi:hypothetical protein
LTVRVGDPIWVGESMSPRGGVPASHHVLIDFEATVLGGELRAGGDAADAAFVPLAQIRELKLTPTMYELMDLLDARPLARAGDGPAGPGSRT